MTCFAPRSVAAAISFFLASTAIAAPDLASAQKSYQRRDAPALRLTAEALKGQPLEPWARAWALLSEARPDLNQLEKTAKQNQGSLMERRLRERSAWERLSASDVKGAERDLSPYDEQSLSAAGKCVLWSAQQSTPADPQLFESALAASSAAPPCVRAAALAANDPTRQDSLLAALAASPPATRLELLKGIQRSPAASASAIAFAIDSSSKGSLLNQALSAKASLASAEGIPSRFPRLRATALSLAAQGAFNAKRQEQIDRFDAAALNKEGAWALFRLALLADRQSVAIQALSRINELDPESSRAMFWTALLIDPDGPAARALMSRNNYHGFVLRSSLGRPLFAISPARAQKAAADCSSYAQSAPVLLAQAGAGSEAQQAWAYELNKADEGQRRCMAKAAQTAGASPLALSAWSRVPSASLSDLKEQWRVGERAALENAAERRLLPVSLLAALARQESRFDAKAVSSVGALGLTQIMPATAEELARKEKISAPNLFDPVVNASLGGRYFKEKLTRLGDARWALSAYNAGETRGRAWSRTLGGLPWIVSVELIPFEETRGYVERVYEGWAAHEELAGRHGAKTLAPAAKSAQSFLSAANRPALKR